MENNTNIDIKSIGKRIREEREKFGLSREEFAEIIGLSDYYVGQLERGERQMSLPVLIKIANCLHLSTDYLIFGKTDFSHYYIRESSYNYSNISRYDKIINLLNKCSHKELELIEKLIKVILPYIGIN